MEVKQDMGMTDKQFNGFIRFLLDALKEAQEEKEPEKKEKEAWKGYWKPSTDLRGLICVIRKQEACHSCFLYSDIYYYIKI